jgi:hypothetical protein
LRVRSRSAFGRRLASSSGTDRLVAPPLGQPTAGAGHASCEEVCHDEDLIVFGPSKQLCPSDKQAHAAHQTSVFSLVSRPGARSHPLNWNMDSAIDTNPRPPLQATNLRRCLCKRQLHCNMLNRLVEEGKQWIPLRWKSSRWSPGTRTTSRVSQSVRLPQPGAAPLSSRAPTRRLPLAPLHLLLYYPASSGPAHRPHSRQRPHHPL